MALARLYEAGMSEMAARPITCARTLRRCLRVLCRISDFIASRYGRESLPEQPPEYKSKSANAQEAHEAIRPTSVMREPESIKAFLEPAMFKLYNLIWQRFVASQMEAAVYDTLQVEISVAGMSFKAPLYVKIQWPRRCKEARNEDALKRMKRT
jgi:DNA topoisomerase IA